MDITVLIPLLNEEESIGELAAWIKKVMKENNFSYEILFIDDGSTDNSWKVIEEMSAETPEIKGIRFSRNYGKSGALHIGFEKAQGDVVITMDADLQDSPDEIPELYRMCMEDGYDLVSGWKKKRYDPISKTIPTKFYNWTTRRMSGIKLHDFNCGLKAYKNDVIKNIEVYGEMHRYIPVIAKWSGFTNIGEKVVQHRKRKYGKSKFGISRFIRGPLDLLTIMFVGKFSKRPMHFFGSLGTLLFLSGFVMAGWLAYEKIFHDVFKITERPLFYMAILFMIIGSQLFIGGFLAEMIGRNNPDRNKYVVKDYTNIKNNE
ncbi:MAG: glycosyltransferase [Marinilabiliales bacterium]|nr:MAG: glycosyltransferase [Marinilabiliales bacterium]